jgi:RHS repeat-associated protein
MRDASREADIPEGSLHLRKVTSWQQQTQDLQFITGVSPRNVRDKKGRLMKSMFVVGLAAFLGCCLFAPRPAAAAEAWQEYDKLINNRETVAALGPTLFGDEVNLATGGLSFSNTDISIPGNNALPVGITRTYTLSTKAGFPDPDSAHNDGHFGDWDLDLPNIGGVYAASTGWVNARSDRTLLRCSVANTVEGSAPSVIVGANSFQGTDYWHGNRINIPGKGSRAMLVARSDSHKPATGGPYFWGTSDWTSVSCLPSILNGTGEGFLAVTSDGTKYWFNWMGSVYEQHMRQGRMSGTIYDTLQRRRYGLYATRVEDRFGNWVTYTYTNAANAPAHLTNIDSSDARHITLAYVSGLVSSISDGSHTWLYQYTGSSLSAVVLPDNSRWTFDLSHLNPLLAYYSYEPGIDWRNCTNPGDLRPPLNAPIGTITHPSGAVGQFELDAVRFYRTVPDMCSVGNPKTTNDDVSYYPNVWDAYALIRKSVSGPGLATAQWTYQYNETYSAITEVTGPSGDYTRYTFGVGFRTDEGKLNKVEHGTAPTNILKTETTGYQLAQSGQPFPTPVGDTTQPRSDDFTEQYLRPQVSNAVALQGATFSSNVTSFDGFARPVAVTKSSSMGSTKTDTTTYYDDLTKWVLGQVANAATNGVQTTRSDYDAVSDLPTASYAFGKLQQTLAYNADGTLATAKDGNNNVTTLSNWYRGVPRNITNADNTTQSASVDANGWVTSVVDANGFSTGYGYDAMGRIASVVYPTLDSTVWTTTTQTFQQITAPENGFPVGHWRQLVQTGNAVKLTYFDALLRPLVTDVYDAANVNGTLSQTVVRYDTAGHQAFKSYPTGYNINYAGITQGIRSTFDALDRPVRTEQDSELGVLASTTEYLTGFQVRTTNPRGQQTLTTTYQAYDQPTYALPGGISQPEGQYTEIYRDVFGKPTAVLRRNADASQAAWRRYVYDGNQQLCKTIEPETGATVMDYDAAGNVQWAASGVALPSTTTCDTIAGRDSGRKVTRYYDARNRVSSLSFPDNIGNQAWTYTPDGLPQQITTTNDSGTTVVNAYSYNKRRMLAGESVNQPGWYTWGIGYGYDTTGNLSGQQYPTGLYVDYAPNALGQATKVGSYATGVSYYPNGGIAQFTYGNGIVHTMTQNARQIPARSTDSGVFDFTFKYDANGNTTNIDDVNQVVGQYSGSRDMQYDGADRLTYAHLHWWQIDNFSYDALDNIRSKSHFNGSTTVNYNYWHDAANRLTNVQDASSGASIVGLGYDVQGNLANKNGKFYSFDYGNRLRGTNEEWYRYDGLGRRVLNWRATESGVLSQYSRSGALVYDENYRASGRKATEYVYLGGSLVAERERNIDTGVIAVKYQHTDALGSPVAVTNAAGQVIDRTQYEPFGATISKPAYDGIGYAGHVMDGATGLTYMQQRYYDPQIGRFLSVDPVTADGNTGSNFNRYKYAANNPYRFTDPDGRYECTASKGQCKEVAKAVKDIVSASHSSIAGGTRIPKISSFLGKEGVKNGVVITSSAGKDAGSATTENGVTTLSINFKEANNTDKVSSVVAHEGSHGLDQTGREKQGLEAMTTSRTDLNVSELNANTAEAHLFRALGRDSPYDMWTREKGINNERINSDADRSVKSECSERICGP